MDEYSVDIVAIVGAFSLRVEEDKISLSFSLFRQTDVGENID